MMSFAYNYYYLNYVVNNYLSCHYFPVPEGAPRDIRVQALNDSAISVSWKEPTEKSGRIRGYFVYYLNVKDNHELYPHKTLPDFYDAHNSQARVRW